MPEVYDDAQDKTEEVAEEDETDDLVVDQIHLIALNDNEAFNWPEEKEKDQDHLVYLEDIVRLELIITVLLIRLVVILLVKYYCLNE